MKLYLFQDRSYGWSKTKWLHLCNHPNVECSKVWMYITYKSRAIDLAANCKNGIAGYHLIEYQSDNLAGPLRLAHLRQAETYWPGVLLGLLNTPTVRKATLAWIKEACR